MRLFRRLSVATMLLAFTACVSEAQQNASDMVVSSDPELAELAAQLLPDLATRSGLELTEPVRLEKRSRGQLVRYLEAKLDEELPADEARAMVETYALLGLVPEDLDLRALLLALYTEQVAGFYEPDSTALFVMDDQPREALEGLLVHELVHAVQDQTADLDALTDPGLGNDRATAAQAAIEGHATLVMLEYMTEQMSGVAVDLGSIPDFASQLRPALEGMRSQFPALANAPRVIQESLLFPYLEGAGFVQSLWAGGERVAPFGERLPLSTEQVITGDAGDPPIELELTFEGGRVLYENGLGRLELGVMLDEHLADSGAELAEGWGGDRFGLVEGPAGRGLIWYVLWDDPSGRDRFAAGLESALDRLGGEARLERTEVAGHPAALIRIGNTEGVTARVRAKSMP